MQDKFNNQNSKDFTNNQQLDRFYQISFILLISLILVYQLYLYIEQITSFTRYIVQNPRASYDQKMRTEWKDFYDYMVFVKNVIPEEATVIIPPSNNSQSVYQLLGNISLVRFFLYPRTVINYEQGYDLKEADYLLLLENDKKQYFTTEELSIDKIWVFGETNQEINTDVTDDVFLLESESYQYNGIIKLKKRGEK